MSLTVLKGYIKKHGKTKAAVALGLKETSAINNWLSRKSIPKKYKDAVKKINSVDVVASIRGM